MASILKGHPRSRGVIHSFTAGPAEAERYLAAGWMLAFNGVLTFKNADGVREAARIAPVDRILVETDSPYLAPIPHRGARCEPAFVAHTLTALARCRGEAIEALDAATTRNAISLFRLPASTAVREGAP
jgi:TatD DNase family protein